jgi:dihydroorotase
MEHGFPPDVISTDLHSGSVMNQVDMPNCISKLMSLGMGLQEAIMRSTVNPARAIHKFPELGTLGRGKAADIAVFDLQKGVFAFMDARRKKLLGTHRLHCVLTIRDGKVVFDENGLSFPLWDEQ